MAATRLAKQVDDAMEPHAASNVSAVSNPNKAPAAAADDSGEMMKALVWKGKNDVRIVDVPKPKLMDAEDTIIKITGTTVCGSDLHLLHGAIIELESGDILGHEFMGVVESVGPEVTKVKAGDRVVASFNLACGKCWMCQRKLSSACSQTNKSSLQEKLYGNKTAGFSGYSHFTGGFAGGQAEYARVPFSNFNLLPIPDSVPDEEALYLSDILATSYHQVQDTGVEKGDIVGIWGAGAIGVMVAKWCQLKGASRIIVVDNVDWRMQHLKRVIGSEVELVNFNEHTDVVGRINQLTGPGTHPEDKSQTRPAGLDVAFECAAGEYAKSLLNKVELVVGLQTDTAEIVNECIMSVIPFGRVGVTGVYAAFCNHFNIGSLMERGVMLKGNGQAPVMRWAREILDDYIVPGKIKPTELFVSHIGGIDDIPSFYEKMDKKEQGVVKPFIRTKFTDASIQGNAHLKTLD